MKILITEQQIKNLINEYIHPDEAKDDVSAVETVCSGKRGVAMISLDRKVCSDKNYNKIIKMVSHCDLNSIRIPSNEFDSYFVFANGYEKQARRLLQIAEKYGGYLSPKATEEETREIGKLLEYDPIEVEKFIKNGNRINPKEK